MIGLCYDSDFTLRRLSVEALGVFANQHPQTLKPFKKDIAEVLGELKFDKMKPVREAATEALGMLKAVPDSVREEESKAQDASKKAKNEQAEAVAKPKKSEVRKPRIIDNSEVREFKAGS